MTVTVRTFKYRRNAARLLTQLGFKPYEHDALIQAVGARVQVTLQDGMPVSATAMRGAAQRVAEALTAGAASIGAAVTKAVDAVEAAAAGTPFEGKPERLPPTEREIKERARLANRYRKLEARAFDAKHPRRKVKLQRPKRPKKRKKPIPRAPCLDDATVRMLVKGVKATTVAGACKELYLAGHSTREVWLVIKKKFSLPQTKQYIATWHQSNYRRLGQLPPAGGKK